jgi:hypothetical protein
MTVRYVVLAEEIADEIKKLKQVEKRIKKSLASLQKATVERDIYVDSLALNIHSFYTGLERIFENIASKVDGEIPTGESWHKELLIQMSTPLQEIRPQVISESLLSALNELLTFRHRIRNIYSFKIDPKRVVRMCKQLDSIGNKIFEDLNGFVSFLRETGKNS